MPEKSSIAKKVLSLAICILFALGLIFAFCGGVAEARQSLANIERIKEQGGAFRILEILPDKNEGSIGYLIAGQEPIGDWTKTAASLGSPQEREDYVNGLIGNLSKAGLLAKDDTAPLENLGNYEEYLPWAEGIPDDAVLLELNKQEKTAVSGSFSLSENGHCLFVGGYKIDPNGSYIQNIAYFTSMNPEGEEEYYWYKPTFTEVTNWEEVSFGTAIYKNTNNYDNPEKEPAFGSYEYFGGYWPDDEGLSSGKRYYTAAVNEQPSAEKKGENIYAAIADGFIPIEQGQTGYFKQKTSSYLYVGSGGDYNYSATGTDKHTISYDTVYYTGGIRNNEWFLRHVFDWEEGEERPRITVNVESVSVNDLIPSQIESASLIVISQGCGIGKTPAAYINNDDKVIDLEDLLYDTLLEACHTKDSGPLGKPVIIDNRIFDKKLEGLNISSLARELTRNKNNAHVLKNVYCAAYPLVSKSLVVDFPPSAYGVGQPFFEVYSQINLENSLRGEGEDLLPKAVNPARAFRHIIARSEGEVVKGTIEVLEIQPGKTGEINPQDVRSWLGADKDLKVNITTQSASELIGKIEPIYQTYDLVYIGGCTKDFKTATINGELITSYDDDSMNGLIYTNIGDTVRAGGESGFSLSGLLDRDYNSTVEFNHYGTSYKALKTGYNFNNLEEKTRTFRLSGNDLTKQKLQELKDYANSGYPVVLANDLCSSLTIEKGFENTGTYSYLWGQNNYNIQLDISPDNLSLTAIPRANGTHRVIEATYQWYKYEGGGYKKIDGETGPSLNIAGHMKVDDDLGKFYCEVFVTRIKLPFFYYDTYKNKSTSSNSKAAVFQNSINENRVDNSSMMYELLESIEGKPAVVPRWRTENQTVRNLLSTRANLKKPEIVFAVSGGKDCLPEPYTGLNGKSLSPIDQGNQKSGYELSFRFHLKIDPNFKAETYQCCLYVDLNGDGRYTEDERLNNLTIREWDMETQSPGIEVSERDLQTGKEYIISRRLPSDMLGIIPWKLEFENINTPRINCNQTGYTHIKPQSEQIETINILQINNKDNSGGDMINLESSHTFQRLFDEVRGEFDINLMTVGAQELDGLLEKYEYYLTDLSRPPRVKDSPLLIEYLRANVDSDNNIVRYSGFSELLNSFDMLVLGFGDSYQGISWESAKAITDFIKTGKACLFSHDCSSFFFLPFKEYQTENEQFKLVNLFRTPDFVYSKTNFAPTASFTMFGYEFNMAIRDAVGLDRYGITNPIFGITQYAPEWLKKDLPKDRIGIVASTDYTIGGLSESRIVGGLTQEVSKHLRDAGYSIAYKPKAERKETVSETQGLSSGVLMRYYKSGGKPTVYDNPSSSTDKLELVTEITQVNSGQITFYPYDINTKAFGGTDDSITKSGTNNKINIEKTHSQYQQLNLNSEDIVVWYCLAGGSFDNSPNDVINNYYLYSRGNVTYTGFGHIEDKAKLEDRIEYRIEENDTEAKLFVNTMIAAYRAAKSELQIKFTDESGEKELTSFLMPSDNGRILKTGGNSDKTRRIFFTISDLSEVENQTLSVSFSYGGNGKTQLSGLDIYDASSQKPVSESIGFVTGKIYYIKLDDVLEKIGDEALEKMGVGGISLNADARSMSAGSTGVSSDTLMLRKLNLLNLY